MKNLEKILLILLSVSVVYPSGRAQSQDVDEPEPKQVEVYELTGPNIEYMGRLGKRLGTPLIVSATIERPNTKAGFTYMVVTEVDGEPTEKARFMLRSKGEIPEATEVSQKYRVCESAEIVGGHPALNHEYEKGTTKIKQRRLAGMLHFSIVSTLILMPD